MILLDEAHVTKAFSQTLNLINRYRRPDETSPPMNFVQMTATPAWEISESKRFSLKGEKLDAPGNELLKARQEADKLADIVPPLKKTIVDALVERAKASLSDKRKAIGIIVNRVQTARDIYEKLARDYPDTFLVIGRMRPIDRDDLQAMLRTRVGPDRPEVLPQSCFVVATQCLEVGADYDFDALFTESASIDALRQRFGRLNRAGRDINVEAAIFTTDASLKDEDPIYGSALKKTWDWLNEGKKNQVNFGIVEFNKLWNKVDVEVRQSMLAPAPNAAVLLPAHLDALCQTSPQPVPSPDVSYFIHGPQRDNLDVSVCWRADLDPNKRDSWADIVGLLPPTSPECMTVPLRTFVNWMRGKPTRNDADVAVRAEEDDAREMGERCVLVWRGKRESEPTNDPRKVRPGDTIVIPATDDYADSYLLGHLPSREDGSRQVDIAEEAFAEARRQRVIRIHPTLPLRPEINEELRKYAASEEVELGKRRIREFLGSLADGFSRGPDEIPYPDGSGILFRFNDLLEDDKNPFRPIRIEDDGDDSTAESTRSVGLDDHTAHVVERAAATAELVHLNGRGAVVTTAAKLHDIGKADIRFQAMLAGVSPIEAIFQLKLLAKSGERGITSIERRERQERAKLPPGFRHEMLSVEIVASRGALQKDERDLALHLIAAHHGYARPFAPVCVNGDDDELLSVQVNDLEFSGAQRRAWIPSHRLDSGIADRFWKLVREHGWWGLAWLESILRLADQQASAAEQLQGIQKGRANE